MGRESGYWLQPCNSFKSKDGRVKKMEGPFFFTSLGQFCKSGPPPVWNRPPEGFWRPLSYYDNIQSIIKSIIVNNIINAGHSVTISTPGRLMSGQQVTLSALISHSISASCRSAQAIVIDGANWNSQSGMSCLCLPSMCLIFWLSVA